MVARAGRQDQRSVDMATHRRGHVPGRGGRRCDAERRDHHPATSRRWPSDSGHLSSRGILADACSTAAQVESESTSLWICRAGLHFGRYRLPDAGLTGETGLRDMSWRTLPWDHVPSALLVSESAAACETGPFTRAPAAKVAPGAGLLPAAATPRETWQVVREHAARRICIWRWERRADKSDPWRRAVRESTGRRARGPVGDHRLVAGSGATAPTRGGPMIFGAHLIVYSKDASLTGPSSGMSWATRRWMPVTIG